MPWIYAGKDQYEHYFDEEDRIEMKRTIRSAAAICLAVFLSLAAAGCAGSSDSDRQVARIGQTVITLGNLETFTALKMYRDGYDPSGAKVEQKKECLSEMVDAEVIRQYYESNGTEIYDDTYNSGKDVFLGDMQSNDRAFLDQNGITYDDLVYFYRAQFVKDKFFMETRSQHNPEEISAEARDYYDAHREDYVLEKEKRVSMILTNKKKQAEEVVERLDRGEDFAAIAQEVSIDENSAVNGGDLGFFRRQELRDRFGKGLFNLEIGEYTENPVKTKDGYAILRITDSHDSGYLSFEEVAQDIMYLLYQDDNNQRIEEIKDSMEVQIKKL